ncbi:uncharacterized protein TNCV_269401 [Trichonephila clavipes]|nr:uncharacterized protein TNCV_269401 [Trichonephila clavipes]
MEEMVEELQEQRNQLLQDAKRNIQKIQAENKRTYDRKRKKAPRYQKGDLVAIQRTHFGSGRRLQPNCLQSRHAGPTPEVTVWGAIFYIYDNRSTLVVIPNPLTANLYASLSADMLLCHVRSPDLSPIEHVRNINGRQLHYHPQPALTVPLLTQQVQQTEIGTGNSDNGSLRDESSGFERVQRRSNDSRDGKKKGSEVKRQLEEKGLSFRNNQGEKHINETNKRRPLIRSIPSSWSGGPERKVQKGSEHRVNKRALSSNYRTNHSLTKFRKKSRREETVTSTTSGYNLRPRIGKRKESRPTIERKTQQGGPVRSRKGRERNDSPYIEERTRSSNKNARRGGDQ